MPPTMCRYGASWIWRSWSLRSRTDHAAIVDDALAAHEVAGLRRPEHRYTAAVVGLPDALQGRLALGGAADIRIVPQGPRKVGLNQARGDGVDADVVLAPFH